MPALERLTGLGQQTSEKGIAIAANCIAAVTMLIVNKYSIKALPFPIILVLTQNTVTLVIVLIVGLYVAKGHKIFGFRVPLTTSVVRIWFPAMLLFLTMLISSLSAMRYISVPSVLVFRALTPLVTSSISVPVLGHRPSRSEWGSLLLIVVGAMCYLGTDPSVSAKGYIWMTINLFAASTYVVYVKQSINHLQPTTNDLMLYNNLLSLPLLCCLVPLFDDPAACLRQMPLVTPMQWVAIIASLFCAGFIAFTGFLLQAAVAPTTTVIINHLTKVVSFVLGAILFKNKFGLSMIAGAIITLTGTIWYSHESQKPRGDDSSSGEGTGDGNGKSRSSGSSGSAVGPNGILSSSGGGSSLNAEMSAAHETSGLRPAKITPPDEETGLLAGQKNGGYRT